MGSVRHQRGRLPQRVYWVRRSLVLLVALALVFGIGKLLGGNGEDPSGSDLSASQTSVQQEESSPPSSLAPIAPSATAPAPGKGKQQEPLAVASGECRDDEVSVLPSVARAWGAQPITIRLALTSLQPACTFEVSPESLVVKITSGEDRIWSSQDCTKAIPTRNVVVRSAVPTYVNMVWSGRRSDEGCTHLAEWADKGFYHVYAAAYGSTPTDVQFEITRAPTAVVTKTIKPKPTQTPTQRPTQTPTGGATGKQGGKAAPSATPTETVKGKQSACGGDNSATSC